MYKVVKAQDSVALSVFGKLWPLAEAMGPDGAPCDLKDAALAIFGPGRGADGRDKYATVLRCEFEALVNGG